MALLALRRLLVALILITMVTSSARAQQRVEDPAAVSIPVNISVFPGLSISDAVTSATGAPTISKLSYNIFAGRSYALEGAEFGSLWNAKTGYVHGVQFAGLANTVAEEVSGAQFAGLASIAGGALTGGQFAGLVSIAGDGTVGIQASGLASLTGDDLRGIQSAGLVSMTGGRVTGAQFAGLVSMAGSSADVQFAGLVSMAGDDAHAIQASGLVSLAGNDLHGLQVSGLASVAGGRVTGAQIAGVINVAPEVNGVQIGAINVSERHTGVPIGLLSYVRETGLRYDIWADETGLFSTAIRSGNESVSNYVGAGVLAGAGDFRYASVAGLGLEGGLTRTLFGSIDAVTHSLHGDDFKSWANLSKLRLMLGMRISSSVAFIAGPTMNVFVSSDSDGSELAPWSVYETQSGDVFVRMWPGFSAGIRISPRGF